MVRAVWVSFALVLAVLAFRVEPAAACSCAVGDPRTMLAEADAAFVGTFVAKHGPLRIQSSADDAVYVFRIEQVVKGSLGATVDVVSATDGASCGLEVPRWRTVVAAARRSSSRRAPARAAQSSTRGRSRATCLPCAICRRSGSFASGATDRVGTAASQR
jgi:hypothetical protein